MYMKLGLPCQSIVVRTGSWTYCCSGVFFWGEVVVINTTGVRVSSPTTNSNAHPNGSSTTPTLDSKKVSHYRMNVATQWIPRLLIYTRTEASDTIAQGICQLGDRQERECGKTVSEGQSENDSHEWVKTLERSRERREQRSKVCTRQEHTERWCRTDHSSYLMSSA